MYYLPIESSFVRLRNVGYMKSVSVRKVLIKRTVSFLLSRGLTLNDAIERGWFNPVHLRHLKTSEKAWVKSNPLVV